MAGSDSYRFFSPARVVVGRGARESLPELLTMRDVSSPLVVTDRGLVDAGVAAQVTDTLEAAGVTPVVYDGVEPNPPIRVVNDCFAAYRAGSCDCIIVVGGGSSIDAAKCAGVLASNGGTIESYFGARVPKRVPYLVVLPTTYGTGSEVTPFAVITDDSHYKAAVRADEIIPDVGILDADLAVGLPLPVAAATGMDALTHAVECFVATTANPMADAMALQAMRMIAANLRQAAVSNGNYQATENMLVASALAGIAFSQTLLGNVHAMSHPVSGHFGVAHGVANAVLLPRVMAFNLIACPDRFAAIAAALGENAAGLSDLEAGQLAVEAVESLNSELGIPAGLAEAGAEADGIPRMAEDAMKSPNIDRNPRATALEDVIELYEDAF